MGLGYLGERRLREVVIGEKVGRYRPHPVRRLGVRVGPGEVGQLVVTRAGGRFLEDRAEKAQKLDQ